MIPSKAIAPAVLAVALAALYFGFAQFGGPDRAEQANWVRAAFVVAAGITLVRLFSHGLFAFIFQKRTGREAPELIRLVVSIVCYTALALLVSWYVDFDLSPLAATSAVLSIVLGLALQDTLGNFFAGLSLHIDEPYQIGDAIRVNGMLGRVESVSWRTTSVRTNANNMIVFPNSHVARQPVEVFPLYELNRRSVRFPAPLSVPPQKVIRSVLRAVRSVPGVSPDRKPTVRVDEFGDSRIWYEALYWVTDYMTTPRIDAEVQQRVWYVFERSDVPAPFPVQYLHLERGAAVMGGGEHDYDGLVRSVQILEPLSDVEREVVVGSLAGQLYAPGEGIIALGDEGDSMFIIERGEVEVTIPGPDDEPRRVAVLGPGDFFGEMALFTGEPRTADVTTLTESELVEIRKPVIERLFSENERLAGAFSAKIAERQAELVELAGADADTVEPLQTILARVKKFFHLP